MTISSGGPLAARIFFAAGLSFAAVAPAAAEGPLAPLAGSWSGGGAITMSNGASERIRCRATYIVSGGSQARQDLRCASDSYRVDIQSNVSLNGSALVGTWTETSRGVSGQVRGTASPGAIQASIAGPGFGANLSISTRGSSQSISIRVNGGDVASVSMSLRKN